MNYSTLKKTVVLSCVSLFAVGLASAQTDSTKTATAKPMTMADTSSKTAKVFGGVGQYNTLTLGANVGVTSPHLGTGGTNRFLKNVVSIGFGANLTDQLSHSFALQLAFQGGKVKGNNSNEPNGTGANADGFNSFSTQFYSGTLNGVFTFGSLSFLHRKNSVNFYASAGAGLDFYNPTFISTAIPQGFTYSKADGGKKYVKELIVPVGVGVKFRLTDALGLDLGYTENFLDGFNFTGDHGGYPSNHDHYSYGYAGLSYTFGSKSKPYLEWVNPVAMMYDELYDAALRQEVEALKGRVGTVETSISDLKKDSDGDGVADQFDKCPNTPAGTVVDGSGCPLVIPKIDTAALKAAILGGGTGPGTMATAAYSNIQFEFDSSVLKTSSYPVLDATSADLRSSGKTVTIDGYASSEGTAAHNMRLSKDRANSVKTYLVNSGVESKKVKIKGYGETHPIADNSTEDGRVLNRRVEFKKK